MSSIEEYYSVYNKEGNPVSPRSYCKSYLRVYLKQYGVDLDGFRYLNEGAYSICYRNKKKNTVLKVTADIPYLEYAKLAMKEYKNNPLFPKILSIEKHGRFFTVETPFYETIDDLEYDNKFYLCVAACKPGWWDVGLWTRKTNIGRHSYAIRQNIERLQGGKLRTNFRDWLSKTTKKIARTEKMLGGDIVFDLHTGNIMKSKRGYVITDPVA